MKIIAFALLVLSGLSSCSRNNDLAKEENTTPSIESEPKSTAKKVEINGQQITINPVDSSDNYLIEGKDFSGVVFHGTDEPKDGDKAKSFKPSHEEVLIAESILKRCIEVDKVGIDSMEVWPDAVNELRTYKRQYFGSINSKGQRIIWVNCFPKGSESRHTKWMIEQVQVQDGGKDYFSLLTNISTHECSRFFRNSIGG